MDIFLDTVNRRLASPLGGPPQNSEIPVFPYSTEVPVTLHLVADGQNTPSSILGEGWVANAGISTTAAATDQPEMWAPSDSVVVDHVAQTLAFDGNCLTVPFKAAINGKDEPVQAWFGVKLYAPGATQPSYSYRVRVYLDNIVYDEGVDPPDEPIRDYYVKTQVDALLAGKAASHPLRTDIGRDLVDGDNLFVGFGLVATCSRLCAYVAAKLAGAYDDGSVVHSPAGTVIAGRIYRQGVGAWVLANPDDPLCETYELFLALGTTAGTDGMARRRTVTGAPSGANGAILWLDTDGAQTPTTPNSVSHAGKVARAVGYVRDSETWEFDGHLPGMSFEEAAS